MIKNNYKNTILTSMIALTLLTSVIAVGGIQNAYAGVFGELVCDVLPPTVDIVLEAGEEFEELKVIDCFLEEDFFVQIESFAVADSQSECSPEIEVNLFDKIIAPGSLSAQYSETIEVLGDTGPGTYNCDIEFAVDLIGTIFFCEIENDGITVLNGRTGPLTQEEIDQCILDVERNVVPAPFDASNSSPLRQTITVEVPELEPEIIHVHIDVKPESCPNPINTNSKGLLPVAILGNDVDVDQIDVDTILLAGVSPIRDNIEDVATPHTPVTSALNPFDCSTEGPDGIDDLTLKFDMQEIVLALELDNVPRGYVVVLVLTGNLLDGTPLLGYDLALVR